MILSDFLGKGKQINNVVLFGKVLRYVEDKFGLATRGDLHFIELEINAVKFLGEVYDTESTGVDNVSITSGVVYCATANKTLEGTVVTVKNKTRGCNLKLSWLSDTKEKYVSAFNFFKDSSGAWVISENLVEVYESEKNTTFSELKKLSQTKEGVPEPEEAKAYKVYKPKLDTILQDRHISSELDSKTVMGIAKEKLKKINAEMHNIFNYELYENIWSIEELKEGILRVTKADFLEKNKFDDLEDEFDTQEDLVGAYLSVSCGYSGGFLNHMIFNKFKSNGLEIVCSLQMFLMRPYLFSLMYGGLSLVQCDRLVSVLKQMGYPVLGDGRGALIVFKGYRSQNNTIVSLGKLKSFVQEVEVKSSNWVVEKPIVLEDNEDYLKFFEKVGVDGQEKGFISWDNIYKEAFIVYNMKQMAKDNSKYMPKEKIEEVVSELPFELEPKQREAVEHCESGVVIIPGCAGSGKTTISKCISDIIGGQVGYAAPTGKAARRLSESVGMPVRTIHSMFKLGIGLPSFLSPLEDLRDINSSFPPTLIIDEAAMINLDVMFQVIRRLHTLKIKLIMMGDPNQLQPIGNGAIFRDLMKVFKPVQLEVSKRFAGGSGVGYNCKVIVEGGTQLEERDDFIFKNADVATIKRLCVNDFLIGVEKLGLDNVQIATPYVTDKIPWGSTQLNALIQQAMFEGRDDLFLCSTKDLKFYKGTKVVQGSPNLASKPHYRWDKKTNTFSSREDVIGVFNGDVGYVEDLIPVSSMVIDNSNAESEFNDVKAEEFEDYFLIVRFEEDDYALYSAKQWGDKVVGDELSSLDLAYALTVHKLQGSEYRYVIFPISNSDNEDFVSNEMVYTALSRAKKYVTVVGSKGKVGKCLKVRKSPEIVTMMEQFK